MKTEFIQLKHNISLFYYFTFFRWLSFWISTFVLFYLDIGLTEVQILMMISAREIVSLLLEVPSGVFADFFGRKTSLVVAHLFQVVGFVILFYSQNFVHALIANLIIGGLSAFNSGADTALVYDTLKESKKESKFDKVITISTAVNGIALVIASFCGGYIAEWYGLRMPILFNIIAYAIGFIPVLLMKEPPLLTKNTDKDYFKHIMDSAKIITHNSPLLYISIFFALFTTVSKAADSMRQLYFNLAGMDVKYFGLSTSIFLAMEMLMSFLLIYYLKDKLKYQFWFGFILFSLQFVVLALILNPIVGFLAVCFGQVARGATVIFFKSYSNDQIESKYRATSLSFQGFLANLSSIILVPIIGWLATGGNVQFAYLIVAIFFLIVGGYCLFRFARNHN